MKTKLFLTLILLTFVTLVFVPSSFAQEVRIFYVIPTDRQVQDDINSTLDGMIKDAQTLFAETMENHGFGNKTFTFESDSNGNAVVHHVNGKFNNAYYNNNAHTTAVDEIGSQSDSISVIVLDVSKGNLCGRGSQSEGYALIPASGQCFSTQVMAHELGHAFGLSHDSNLNGIHIPNSYTPDRMLTSFCSAEWLDVNPYFNPGQSSSTDSTTIQMLSPLASPPNAVRLRFEVTDSDGLHQAQVLVPRSGGSRVIACKQLNGESNNFDIITTQTAYLSDGSVTLRVIDEKGDVAFRMFSIDISSLLPPSAVVHIPDTNLATAIRETLGLTSEETITQLVMQKLGGFYPNNRQISDLTGIEYAVNLEFTGFNGNQIKDLTPLSGLTQLRNLQLSENEINNLKPLAELTSLRSLDLYRNQITDLSPLAELVGLGSLYLNENNISDITPLSGLTHLTYLDLLGNQISDVSPLPLTALTSLIYLELTGNRISDISPLAELKSSARFNTLKLGYNQISDITSLKGLTQLEKLLLQGNRISDVSPLAELVNLEELHLEGNPIKDREPLLALLRKNPDVKIYLEWGGEPLPVALSHFRAEHTNAGVVLKWTTESEVDNAGFYIYRSQTKSGEFKVVNPTMIQGAGTTGERNEYTWTDTTAKLNTVYYYRIEDVSHAGVREQLATVRLRGLVSASGKLITRWGDFKLQD